MEEKNSHPLERSQEQEYIKKKVAKKVLFATIVAIELNLVNIECKSKSLEIVWFSKVFFVVLHHVVFTLFPNAHTWQKTQLLLTLGKSNNIL